MMSHLHNPFHPRGEQGAAHGLPVLHWFRLFGPRRRHHGVPIVPLRHHGEVCEALLGGAGRGWQFAAPQPEVEPGSSQL